MMNAFVYQASAARVIFGAGTLARLPDEVAQLGATRALVLVDERLYGELSGEIETYLKKASERRGFHIALEAIDGLDDWPYYRVKEHIVAARLSQHAAIELEDRAFAVEQRGKGGGRRGGSGRHRVSL